MMKHDLALAAFVLDPVYHDEAPWTDPVAFPALIRVAEKMLGTDATGEHNEELMNKNMKIFMDEFAIYQAKLGQFSKAYVWVNLESELACVWWQKYGGEGPKLQIVGTKTTAQVAGADMAERCWKTYKGAVSKGRSRLGKIPKGAFRADAEDVETDQTTATKLTYVHCNLRAEDYDDYCISEAAQQLNSFTVADADDLAKAFGKLDVHTGDPNSKAFKNYLESWENDTKKKNDGLFARLRDKYIGMRLRDDENDEDEDEDDEEDYLGEIIGIDFKPKREGAYPKGYYLLTALVKADGKVDESETRVYTISEATHSELITQEDNPSFTFSARP